MSELLPEWPDAMSDTDMEDSWLIAEHERARADAAMARLRVAVEALLPAQQTIGCSCACKRCSTALDRVNSALTAIGELPEA